MFTLSNYKDVDNTVSSIVTRFYELRDAGDYDGAYALIEVNKAVLTQYYINANSFNKIELGIYDLAQFVMNCQKIIISATMPSTANLNTGSEWLQEY